MIRRTSIIERAAAELLIHLARMFACAVLFLTIALGACAGGGGAFVPPPQGSAVVADTGRAGGDSSEVKENERLVAAALALFLGPFGAHRLYFGTTAKVPVIYGITFGGFGILAVLDLGHILFTRDLSRYHACDRVFMWGQGKRSLTPP